MTAYLIYVYETEADVLADHNGHYLKSYDADDCDGRGRFTVTDDLRDALVLPDLAAATALYRRQSSVQPLRPDGKANRPLTGYPVRFVPAPIHLSQGN